jgi:hypothetical protein
MDAMTFIEAIKTRRPMKRVNRIDGQGPWIVIGEKYRLGSLEHPWLRIDTGEELRGIGRSAVNAIKRHCIHGHPFDGAGA